MTNDILEVKQNFIKVMGRKGRILVTEGAWLSLANIEDQLVSLMNAVANLKVIVYAMPSKQWIQLHVDLICAQCAVTCTYFLLKFHHIIIF